MGDFAVSPSALNLSVSAPSCPTHHEPQDDEEALNASKLVDLGIYTLLPGSARLGLLMNFVLDAVKMETVKMEMTEEKTVSEGIAKYRRCRGRRQCRLYR